MTFDEALNFLNSRRNFELSRDFDTSGLFERLVRLREFVDFLGRPDRRYKIIHVAGTKGKGSTCVLIESILMEAGAKVGRFTSPHLYSFLERVTVDGVPCSESDFTETMFYIRDKISQFDSRLLVDFTFFELLTIFAFEYFSRCSVDFAVFEVGLGGSFDATNICLPSVTAIANLSFDHIEQLGPTLRDIAREKGGIIKAGVPLVSTACGIEARETLQEIIESRETPAYFLGESFEVNPITVSSPFRFKTISGKFPMQVDIDDLNVSMFGKHQRENAALAISAVLLLQDKFILNADLIRKGLRKGVLPARVEVFRNLDKPIFVVDGAHNKASVEVFIETLNDLFPSKRKLLVFGTTIGKDIDGMLMELLPNFHIIFMTQYSSSLRCFPTAGLKTIADEILPTFGQKIPLCKIELIYEASQALKKCFDLAEKDDVVCVTGSIYLAAELRNYYIKEIGK
ncbi:MAG: bifunctional folylpolyglutamate synthase/dihydrofolate synthase [Planctomycetaceae bacterium]|jgi:dihydrofolate synthase/folylpolyglutamate synthase|nr:bifunctional folylpolyglutamate synthase/dihydrofolate synthase [Planctomycetaceae bacterium]